ncbi:MAG: metallophosphoesterase [Candidatus Parvarchaeota archaeon]|nr:metallophosphoesterase [Candidatus Parvarchaeota archaeon]
MEIDDIPFRIKKGLPAAVFHDYAVLADPHFGFEEALNAEGYSVASKTNELLADITALNSENLIILGDLRSGYTEILPNEGRELFTILSRLSNRFKNIIITKGNHDGGLSKLTDRLPNIKLVKEFLYRNVGFLHGHALPSEELSKTVKTICFGHLHPSITISDRNGVIYKKDCWSLFDIHLPKKKYKNSIVKYGVAVPKFNKYIGSTDVIRKNGLMRYAKPTGRLSTDMLIV